VKRSQCIGFAGLVVTVLLGTFGYRQAVARSPIDLAAFRSSALAEHNKYRAVHHAPSIAYSDALNSSAQNWAATLASTAAFKHSAIPGVGENIYASYTSEASVDANALGTDAVTDWYDEVKNYDYANPGSSGNTGHFTQVVWKGSTQLGCGAAQGIATINGTRYNAFYVVCQYSPPGNVQGAYRDNVREP
jgi:uncharacterized protein YkwD